MVEPRIPDPTLMARLVLSVRGVDWAASLIQPYQHETGHDDWTPHRDVWHLIDVERYYLQPRLIALLEMDEPDLRDLPSLERRGYSPDKDITELADEFVAERNRTVEILKTLEPEQWFRKGTWSEGRVVDVAWTGERILWHALDHFAVLLRVHNEAEPLQAPRWRPQD